MELVKLNHPLPVKAYPEPELNKIILTEFMPWIARLLSLTGETSAERLEIALPAIKQHCWSMGFNEIKKMFEMYADNKLNIEPRPNYFDRILFGKIVSAYKQQLPTPKNIAPKVEISEEQKELKWISFIINCFEEYKYSKTMLTGYTAIYDHFYSLDKFPIHNHEFREKVRQRAVVKLQTGNKDLTNYEIVLEGKKPNYSEENITKTAKEIILSDWFDKLIENKQDIKTEI